MGKKDLGSRELGEPPGFPPRPQGTPTCPGTRHGSSEMFLNTLSAPPGFLPPPQDTPTCPGTHHGSSEMLLNTLGAPPGFPPPPPQDTPTCPGTHHGSSDMLLNTLVRIQQQHMALHKQQLTAQQQQIELQQQYFLELKASPAPPTFGGSTGLLEAEKWIAEMEKFCRALCIPKDKWVDVVIPFLIGDAEAWFNYVKPTYESGGRRIDWAKFQDIFYLKYIPATFRIEKVNEFLNLKQGSMTVIQYASMFEKLVLFVPAFIVHDQSKITRFKEGLNLNLRECMGTAQATTYLDLLQQAIRAEILIRERKQVRDGKRPRPGNEQYEETDSAANKKATRANKKAVQENLDDTTVHGQDVEISAENNSLPAALAEQIMVNEKAMRLVEEQKKQIEALEKDLDKKKLDVERLLAKMNIMRAALSEDGDIEALKKAEEQQKLLLEKKAELKDKANLNQVLIAKGRNNNNELQDSRKELTNVVHFRSLEQPKEDEFCLVLSKQNSYDEVVESVARRLSLDDPSKIRLTAHNCYSQQPKPQTIEYRGVEHLTDMLVHYNQTSDILYYEVLDIPLPELQGLKTLKVAFHHATTDEVVSHTITLADESTVGDVMIYLKTKVELCHPNAELRLLEILNHKIYEIVPLNRSIGSIFDDKILRAEEVPEDEKNLSRYDDRVIHVYHFMKNYTQNQVIRNFGDPFLLVIHKGETLAKIKSRIQKRLKVSDEEFSKWKFAFISLGRPEYLQDSDIIISRFPTLWSQRRYEHSAWEHYLGLEHLDNTPKMDQIRYDSPFTRKCSILQM